MAVSGACNRKLDDNWGSTSQILTIMRSCVSCFLFPAPLHAWYISLISCWCSKHLLSWHHCSSSRGCSIPFISPQLHQHHIIETFRVLCNRLWSKFSSLRGRIRKQAVLLSMYFLMKSVQNKSQIDNLNSVCSSGHVTIVILASVHTLFEIMCFGARRIWESPYEKGT